MIKQLYNVSSNKEMYLYYPVYFKQYQMKCISVQILLN
jgi:hypothetical protein